MEPEKSTVQLILQPFFSPSYVCPLPNTKNRTICSEINQINRLSALILSPIHFMFFPFNRDSSMTFLNLFLYVLLMLLISLGTCTHEPQSLTSDPSDLKALSGFSSCLESAIPEWNSSTAPDYCSWSGVTCNGLPSEGKRRVVRLELGSRGLIGKVCDSLAGLDELRVLNLSQNCFYGFLPDKLFHLQNLEVIDLSNNHFDGTMNTAVCTFSKRIRVLKMSGNSFSGDIPENLGDCSSLQHLSIDGNGFSGSLPESIFQLQNLSTIYLQKNKLSGPLSKGVGKISNLMEFDISYNEFSGILPNIFGSLTRLNIFFAKSNELTGQLPETLVNSPSLQMLILTNNSFSGSINLNCSAMKSLTILGLGENQFHGPIPVSLSSCPRLEAVSLGSNHFNSAGIPDDFKNLHSLTELELAYSGLHNLSATLEILSHRKNLSVLGLRANFYDEEIPQGQNLQFSNLKVFILANSQVKGSIPEWLSGCKKLQMLDLSWNHLSGSIPLWIGSFDNLYYLDLSNNSFTGSIPQSLTMLLGLQNRNFSLGEIEPLPIFPFYDTENRRMYLKVSSFRPTLVLSYNKLEGPIWPSFGNLKGLHVMDLKENSLSGPIPYQLSGMIMLETLDLSHNKLTGEIPHSLVELSFLSMFDVSYNLLHGEIPTGGQFDTFPITSFEGNMRLYYQYGSSGSMPSLPDKPAEPDDQKLEIIGCPFGFGAFAGFVITIAVCFSSGWILS